MSAKDKTMITYFLGTALLLLGLMLYDEVSYGGLLLSWAGVILQLMAFLSISARVKD
jgi:hypothetical protein